MFRRCFAGVVAGLALFAVAAGTRCGHTAGVRSHEGQRVPGEDPPRVKVIETEPMHIDRIYHSMQGPYAWAEVDESDVGWVTGYKTEVVDARTGDKLPDEFFCHSSLQQVNTTRLFVNATGTEELELPEGFGMPVGRMLRALPDGQRDLRMLGMVLNNHTPDIDRLARVRVTLEYYRDEEVGTPPRLQKLYNTGLTLSVQDRAGMPSGVPAPPGDDPATHCSLVNGFEGHWIVPPGPQITRQRYSGFLPADGTVHLVVVHLHNYGRYMRLTDATTGERLWQADAVYEPGRTQIVKIPTYASRTGFPIYKDHVYEIEAYYDNTSGRDTDAMAMMSLFYHPAGDENVFYPDAPDLPPTS
jgi:hypothetical protein